MSRTPGYAALGAAFVQGRDKPAGAGELVKSMVPEHDRRADGSAYRQGFGAYVSALAVCGALGFTVACTAPLEAASTPAFTARLAPVQTSASSAATAIESAPPPLAPFDVTFHREVEGPITAIALEKPPHVAALGNEAAWIHDAPRW